MNRAAVARAMHCIGTPFRLHGRLPGVALDCVGLAGHVAGIDDLPTQYSLRGEYRDLIFANMDTSGWAAVPPVFQLPGDIALVKCAPRQWHFLVHVPGGAVHAHAGLGRVVLLSGPAPWPVLAAWRSSGD